MFEMPFLSGERGYNAGMLPILVVLCFWGALSLSASPNRYAVLDEFCDLYYPNAGFPKLTTPQWVGEEGVEAALVLAIDDMRDSARYETYLRPILDRLQRIDGRAPVSIMTCQVKLDDPQLQKWLTEGVSLEAHTVEHPCPILGKGDFAGARSTYDRCVDMLAAVPGNRPVAFRTPCMDGINSASPRLYAEIMMARTPGGHFLSLSSSIGVLLTPADTENPRLAVIGEDGKPRFERYLLPGYLNYIKDYPYPWVIGNKIWETGFCMPDDYQGSRVYGDRGEQTVRDMEASIDAVVAKKGIWVMTFHPYQWMTNHQVVQLIDRTVARHGKRVKFLNLREVQERIDRHLLGGQPLRDADGGDNGVRLLDLNEDGYLDVVIGNDASRRTRLWDPRRNRWREADFPVPVRGARFGTFKGAPCVMDDDLWRFNGRRWSKVNRGVVGLPLPASGVRLRDVNGDDTCEVIVSHPGENSIYQWSSRKRRWERSSSRLPDGVALVTSEGRDNGVRFADLNGDGADDLVFSNEEAYGVWLADRDDWREIRRGRRGDASEIPMIVRGGAQPNNGAWFFGDTLYVQNEDTAELPNLVQRASGLSRRPVEQK